MHITFFEVDKSEQAYFCHALPRDKLTFYEHPLYSEDIETLSHTEILVIFIYSPITREIIEKLPSLKGIVTLSTGTDHIDMEACKARGITVCNVPKYGGTAVAEHTFALMLALIRHLPKAVQQTTHDDFSLDGLCGTELAGKTLGIVGAGTIGAAVMQRARAFDMNVIVYERAHNKRALTEKGVTVVSLPHLLRTADIVTLHLPYTPETHHLLNRKTLKHMKQGAYLINTARGGLIDAQALHTALVEKHLAGAALDVLEGETELKEAHQPRKQHHFNSHNWVQLRAAHRLLKLPNVLITPHMAFYTHEAMHTILKSAVTSIKALERVHPKKES